MNKKKRLPLAAHAQKKEQGKFTEKNLVFDYLSKQPATATQAAFKFGIYRPNLSWIKRELEKSGNLWELKKTICPITKHRASLLTCSPELAAKEGANHE